MSDEKMTDEKLMKIAKKRVKIKRDLRFEAILYAAICVVCVVIYIITNFYLGKKTIFWPIFPMLGMALAFVIQLIIFWPDLYGYKNSIDDEIQKEFLRLKGKS